MDAPKLISAVGTPLTENEELHDEGLEKHLQDQQAHGIDGILIAGTMGAMQLLTDETYRSLVERTTELWPKNGEILVGAGDAGFARTRDRITFLNKYDIDGVAVLAPYFWNFAQKDLVSYYKALADISEAPLYLYDLPQVTGTKLELETFHELAQHPNIAGAKCSCDFTFTRHLVDTVPEGFRIIVAQPHLVDTIMHHGVLEHLDGMWSIAPQWSIGIRDSARNQQWDSAAAYQQLVTNTFQMLPKYGFAAFTDLMNARGIPGVFTPRPFPRLSDEENRQLRNEPIIQRLIAQDPARG